MLHKKLSRKHDRGRTPPRRHRYGETPPTSSIYPDQVKARIQKKLSPSIMSLYCCKHYCVGRLQKSVFPPNCVLVQRRSESFTPFSALKDVASAVGTKVAFWKGGKLKGRLQTGASDATPKTMDQCSGPPSHPPPEAILQQGSAGVQGSGACCNS